MKKLLSVLLSFLMVFSLAACSSNNSEETAADDTLKVLCPTGAPSLALASVYEDVTEEGQIDFVDGSDQLVAELSKADSEYNIIVAPINLGAKLISANQTDFKMAAVLTWGNLYLVGTSEDALQGTGEISLFGEGAVPGTIYNTVGIETTLTPTYYSSATLVQQQLLSSSSQVGMLAEPLATATIAKAKENGITLSIIKDLQEEYGEGGYPQATIFVKEGTNCSEFLDGIKEFTDNDYEGLEEYLDTVGTDTLGLPAAQVVLNTVERQNIHYIAIEDCQDEVTDFLELYNIAFSEDMMF